MTMQQTHSPKPDIFGEGYGAHLSYNYRLMKKFFWLGWKMMVNMFIPQAFYERAHWEVIELYHKMRGYRHGTISDHRCPECGGELFSADEMHEERDELKQFEIQSHLVDECNEKLEELDDMSPEEYQWEMIPEDEKAVIMQRIEDVKNGDVETIDWRTLENSTSDK